MNYTCSRFNLVALGGPFGLDGAKCSRWMPWERQEIGTVCCLLDKRVGRDEFDSAALLFFRAGERTLAWPERTRIGKYETLNGPFSAAHSLFYITKEGKGRSGAEGPFV